MRSTQMLPVRGRIVVHLAVGHGDQAPIERAVHGRRQLLQTRTVNGL